MKIFPRHPRLLLIALFLTILSVHSYSQSASDIRLKTVVIDAGHGGKDAGAVSKDGRTYEKNLVLAIAKSFGQKIEAAYPDVKVIYTRTTDKFVELSERAAIANRNKADLFISIHINANNSTSPSGFSAHILGQSSSKNRDLFSSNLELCRRENSVIMLEDDYETTYQGYNPNDPESFIFFNLMQNAYYEQSILFAADVTEALSGGPIKNNRGISQDPFLVLWKTTMPAVLLELGFISNSADLGVLCTSNGREEIAKRLFSAFKTFKTKYDGSVDLGKDEGSTVTAESGTSYGIQIMTLSRRLAADDPVLKGYSADMYKSEGLYRYVVAGSETESGASGKLSSVKKDFPDAYLVKIVDGIPQRL